jgi:hypothetical protein
MFLYTCACLLIPVYELLDNFRAIRFLRASWAVRSSLHLPHSCTRTCLYAHRFLIPSKGFFISLDYKWSLYGLSEEERKKKIPSVCYCVVFRSGVPVSVSSLTQLLSVVMYAVIHICVSLNANSHIRRCTRERQRDYAIYSRRMRSLSLSLFVL